MKIIKCEANLENYGKCQLGGEYVDGSVELKESKDCFVLNVNCECQFYPYDYARVFTRYSSMVITVEVENTEKILAQYIKSPFWVGPAFTDSTTDIAPKSQALLLKHDNDCEFVYALANENFQTTFQGGQKANQIEICVNAISPDTTKLCGTAVIVAKDKDPYVAVDKAFDVLEEKKLIKTILKKHKRYPEALEYLGWCTWNAFYHDVSEKGIIEKMEEFKSKNIPVKWVLIDDGWSEVSEDMTLKSIYEDKNKFPNGLKGTMDILKQKYGIISVGVWHAATGYWKGTDFKNEGTLTTPSGIEVPSGYDFYSTWHNYLKEQGVDFVKVDSQGNMPEFMQNNKDSLECVVSAQQGLDKSAEENFDFMINCMGMVNINMLNRNTSVMCRNSDDFQPDEKASLKNHVVQNVYNAIFNDSLYFCDFDMWWSKHFEAEQNAVLRAVSGGPFYLSDKVGDSQADIISKFVDYEGHIDRYNKAAMPTADCVFGFDKALKIFNTKGDDGVVAVFTFDDGGETTVSCEDFGGSGTYTVVEKLTGQNYTLNNGESIKLKLDDHSVKMFVFTKEYNNV